MAQATRKRINLLDEVRGIAIICMVFFHGFYMMSSIFGWKIGDTLLNFFMPAEPVFAAIFILISGISCQLSHSNAERGAKLIWISIALTAATWWLDKCLGMSGTVIWFGILHFLSLSMLFYAALKKILDKIPIIVSIIAFGVLFAATYNISYGFIGMGDLSWQIPSEMTDCQFLFPFGIVSSGFFSADYFPIFPWLFMFIIGASVGKLFKSGNIPKWFYPCHAKPVAFCGRHTLIIYLLHQPAIYIILLAISRIIGDL